MEEEPGAKGDPAQAVPSPTGAAPQYLIVAGRIRH